MNVLHLEPPSIQHSILKALGVTILPGLFWAILVQLHPHTIDPHCSVNAATQFLECSKTDLLAIDRIAIERVDPTADAWSTWTQNLVGFLGACFVLAVGFVYRWPGSATFLNLLLLARATLWTGVTTETFKQVFNRPRPFVYLNIGFHADNPSNYTSFFSGHSSFTAATTVGLLTLLVDKKISTRWIYFVALVFGTLTLATGWGRIASAKHFTTDVLGGFGAGALIAFTVVRFSRKA